MNKRQEKRWESLLYRPQLPSEWKVLEQLDSVSNSYISFYRWGRTHHNAEPTRIFAVFCEFAPGTKKYLYSVRGGRNAKPDEGLNYFNDLKSATNYLIYIMESTDRWLTEINSEEYIKDYQNRVKKIVEEQEDREARMREAFA